MKDVSHDILGLPGNFKGSL